MNRKLTHLIAAGGFALACAPAAWAQQQAQPTNEQEPEPDEPMPFVAPDETQQAFAEHYDQAMQTVAGQIVNAEAYLIFGREVATDPQDARARLDRGRPLAVVGEEGEAYLILWQRDAEVLPFVGPEPRRELVRRARPASAVRERGQARAGLSPRFQQRIRQQRPLLPIWRDDEPVDDEIEPFVEPANDEPAWQPVDPEDFEPEPMAEPGQRRDPGNALRVHRPGQQVQVNGAVFERGGMRAIVIEGYEITAPTAEPPPRVD